MFKTLLIICDHDGPEGPCAERVFIERSLFTSPRKLAREIFEWGTVGSEDRCPRHREAEQ